MEGDISAQPSLTSLHVADELIRGVNLCDQRFGRLIAVDPYCARGKQYKSQWICICDCGNETVVYARNLVGGLTTSCGCLVKEIQHGRMYKLTGREHPRWNPSISDGRRVEERFAIEYRQWRTSVFERDLYTCRKCCNDTGCRLNAHHLDGYAENTDRRFDIDNGITLCVSCHKEFHKRYGNGGNTQAQYEEWCRLLT